MHQHSQSVCTNSVNPSAPTQVGVNSGCSSTGKTQQAPPVCMLRMCQSVCVRDILVVL